MTQVILDLIFQLLDDFIELFDARGRDDLCIIKEFLHEVVMGKLVALWLFFWLSLSVATGFRRNLFIIVTFGLLGSDDLHSLLLCPNSSL